MSLETAERLYVGHEQSSSAGLTADGVFYKCKIWLSRVEWAIEARCFAVYPNGTEQEVFHNIVARASSTEIADTNGVPLDCPRILAVGTTFVVHWLQCDDITVGDPVITRNWALWRATMDMTAFSITSWTSRGSVSLLETHVLYNHCNAIGDDSDRDFIVTRCTDTAEITTQRFDGFDWVDTVWTWQTSSGVDPNVLAVHAHDADNDVIVVYQHASDNHLVANRASASAGTGASGEVEIFPAFEAAADSPDNDNNWVQVTIVHRAANSVKVIGEAQPGINFADSNAVGIPWIHAVAWVDVNTNTAVASSHEHWRANLGLASEAWAYADGQSTTGSSIDVYAMLAFRSVLAVDEWSQAALFVCNFDDFMTGQVAEGPGMLPRPIVTVTGNSIGIPDARTSGWHPELGDVHSGGPTRRMNHLTAPCVAPPFGADIKTRTLEWPFFATLATVSDPDPNDVLTQAASPERAGVRGLVVYMEDPWTLYRDATDPTQPVDNFAIPYARAMHQSVPWGRGLFIAGGTPQLYDGSQLVECGFLWNPEILNSGQSTGGDLTLLGVYQYYAIYTWLDKQGQLHTSAPSVVHAITLTGVNNAVRLDVRTMTLSLKDSDAFYSRRQLINVELFRTTAGNTVFYRVYGSQDVATPVSQRPRDTPVNDPETLQGYIFIDDGLSDDQLALQGEGPYQFDTNSVFIEPVPQVWPACHAPSLYQNRIVAADSLDPTRFIYSDENIPAAGAATYSAPVLGANQQFRTGEIQDTTGFSGVGSVMYQWTRNKIFALSGSDAGFGALSWTATVVHDELGCVDPKTIVLFPLGIGFQSQKGYYVLARSGEASYGVLARSRDQPQSLAGAAVEDDIREAGNIRAASHSPAEHRIDLVCNGRPTQTSTWTGTITVLGGTMGLWTITGLSQPIVVSLVSNVLTAAQVADALEARIQELIDADAPDTLQFEVASVQALFGTIAIELLPDVELTIAGDGPGISAIAFVETVELEMRPRVLRYHYDVEQWSRADLVQSDADEPRLSEAADGCYWNGGAGPQHVVLAQGQLLVERLATDALAYADQSPAGDVGIPLDITTSWIHFGGLAGYVRIRSIGVLTERDENGAMHVDLEYDRSGALTGQEIQPSTYDWDSPAPAYLRVRPRVQKLSSMRMRIYEDSGVTTAGNTVSIVGLVFDVGVLPGMRRVSDAQVGS